MAGITLTPQATTFPPGTTVGAYKRSNWGQAQLPPSGAPQGSADATAIVGTDSSLAFTGLTAGEKYYAAAQVSGTYRYVSFSVAAAVASGYTPPTFADLVLAKTPVAYWPLDEASGTSFADVSGNALNATGVGGVTAGASGPDGSPAVELNGTTGYLHVVDDAKLHLATFTLVGWMRVTSYADQMMVARNRNFEMLLGVGGYFNFAMPFGGSINVDAHVGMKYPLRQWHLIGLGFDGDEAIAYLDGEFAKALTGLGAADTGAGDLYLGARGGSSLFLPGRLARWAIFDKMLRPQDHAALFAAAAT